MANTITTIGDGGESQLTGFELIEVSSADGNDFTFDLGYSPRKIVMAIEGTADYLVIQWFGLSASDFGVCWRMANGTNGAFLASSGFAIAENTADGGYTVTVDASVVGISSGDAVLIEVWR